MDIVVTPEVTPTFAPIGPLCHNSTAPPLPAASIEGINGTWAPATISTATAGTTTYTFTPIQWRSVFHYGYYGYCRYY